MNRKNIIYSLQCTIGILNHRLKALNQILNCANVPMHFWIRRSSIHIIDTKTHLHQILDQKDFLESINAIVNILEKISLFKWTFTSEHVLSSDNTGYIPLIKKGKEEDLYRT